MTPLLFYIILQSLVFRVKKCISSLDVHVRYLDDGTIIGGTLLVAIALSIINEFRPRGPPKPREILDLVSHFLHEFLQRTVAEISDGDLHLKEIDDARFCLMGDNKTRHHNVVYDILFLVARGVGLSAKR